MHINRKIIFWEASVGVLGRRFTIRHCRGRFGEAKCKVSDAEVKQEEKLRLSSRSPIRSHVPIDTQCSADKFPVIIEKDQEAPSIASSLNYCHSNQSGSIDRCSRPSEGVIESGSSDSTVYSPLKPDFSMTDGEICLDKLSIKELHERFKVTYGSGNYCERQTVVEEKDYLLF